MASVTSDVPSSSSYRVKVGMVQMTSVNDKETNFRHNQDLVKQAKEQDCKMVFFPENFSFMGARPGEAQTAAEELTGPTITKYKELAKENNIWLSLGGFQEKGPSGSEKIYNTHVIISAEGKIVAWYRKIHLYDVPMVGLVESRQSLPGEKLVSCDSPVGTLGVTICYDLRFPEVYQKLTFLHGAQVLLVPSAFAVKTGQAHWETLLRARAIETQCYVIAAAQVGQHNEDGNKRQSYGHSVAIDPWGKILIDMEARTGLTTFEIDPELVKSTRDNMPMHKHRRYDIYGDGPHARDQAHEEEKSQKKEELFFG
eukprot:TRINITY_DN18864_c0_g2_i1.p1 TRINITY_DN18864_c0_g2~~TRINITY_DN18864_c0_g2_i1.p1  ORF type:complete len:312 (-),score=64.22 TRINITY_DN18864_c0_g2_i1:258-1193(-)